MLRRKAFEKLLLWKKSPSHRALLITGARQVGKTYLIRQLGAAEYESFVELNFILNKDAAAVFKNPSNTEDILLRLSLLADAPLIPGKTLVFFDEVQECSEVVTAIKGLVDEGSYDYALSGSLLGVELKDIRSNPVGYLSEVMMYPLDFEEFCWAVGVNQPVLDKVEECFKKRAPVDEFIHDRMLKLFRRYLVVGGMPDAVSTFVDSNDLALVRDVQSQIRGWYRQDISKYCDERVKLKAKEAYDLVPSELSNPNKRFILKRLNERARFKDYEDAFIWLTYANVALAAYCVDEPCAPLLLSKERNLFKLFYSDVGLLTSSYLRTSSLEILDEGLDLNYGSTFENAVAQELVAHGFSLYYYNSKKFGEVDFVVADKNDTVLPIEVKSGKNYYRHKALSNILKVKNYHLKTGYIFGSGNVEVQDNLVYSPIYMIGQLSND